MKETIKTSVKFFNIKSNSGITLVALIVTIVVLLIIAGISIRVLDDENRNNKKI